MSTQRQSYDFSVAITQERMRLDRFLATIVPDNAGLSRTRLTQLIKQGAVLVDGAPSYVRAQPLHIGQQVRLTIEKPNFASNHNREELAQKNTASSPPLEILFEDEHILCFVKPAGLITHPAPSTTGETLVDRLCRHCAPMLAGYPENPRCGIVHRLDKNTSGVMLAAKTEEARLRLSEMFASHTLQRRYLALVWGVSSPAQGCISAPLARHPTQRTKKAICRDAKKQGKARHAVTHYKTMTAFGYIASLLSCELETGRTHQIRVHLASIGHPVIGDQLYSENNPCPRHNIFAKRLPAIARHALHAEQLAFAHPITQEPMSFSSPPPSDFQALQAHLASLAEELC